MEMKVFSIYDSKAKVYHPPIFQRSHADAERAFHRIANDPNSLICQYPEDYDLMYLGKFDDQTSHFELEKAPSHIAKAVQFKSGPTV